MMMIVKIMWPLPEPADKKMVACVCVFLCLFSNCSDAKDLCNDPRTEKYTDTDILNTLFKLQVSNTHSHTHTCTYIYTYMRTPNTKTDKFSSQTGNDVHPLRLAILSSYYSHDFPSSPFAVSLSYTNINTHACSLEVREYSCCHTNTPPDPVSVPPLSLSVINLSVW